MTSVLGCKARLDPMLTYFLSLSRKAQIEIGIEFVISFGEIIQLACQQAVLTT